ncbi:hypothetical protein BRC84_06735 [Halobacteriales archaeon QS_1_68_44]|nr:MAG: hypothetical protein BRC84_06735 [Halobacteriales archaeon QS_1_68_44]
MVLPERPEIDVGVELRDVPVGERHRLCVVPPVAVADGPGPGRLLDGVVDLPLCALGLGVRRPERLLVVEPEADVEHRRGVLAAGAARGVLVGLVLNPLERVCLVVPQADEEVVPPRLLAGVEVDVDLDLVPVEVDVGTGAVGIAVQLGGRPRHQDDVVQTEVAQRADPVAPLVGAGPAAAVDTDGDGGGVGHEHRVQRNPVGQALAGRLCAELQQVGGVVAVGVEVGRVDDVAGHRTEGMIGRPRVRRVDRHAGVRPVVVVDERLEDVLAVDVGVGATDHERVGLPPAGRVEFRGRHRVLVQHLRPRSWRAGVAGPGTSGAPRTAGRVGVRRRRREAERAAAEQAECGERRPARRGRSVAVGRGHGCTPSERCAS